MTNNPIIIALPKGRIAEELVPLLSSFGIEPEDDFFNKDSRALMFDTSDPNIKLARVRSFDVATFVSYGAAHIGVAGQDVLLEHDHPELYTPLDLGIGACRLSLAVPHEMDADEALHASHIRVATKYIRLTKQYFATKGLQAECIKLNGAIELAPRLGLCRRIVDLVSTGSTLKANGLKEIDTIVEITSRLIVNRSALKTRASEIDPIIQGFESATHEQKE